MDAAIADKKSTPLEGRRERRRRELRLRIFEVSRELFLEQGFEATTVEQIAERSDIVPATFFNHFRSKAGVLALMTSEVADALSLTVEQHLGRPGTIRQRVIGLAEDAASQIQATQMIARDVMLTLVRSEGRPENSSPYLQRVYQPLCEVLEEGQAQGEISSTEDPMFLAEMVLGGLNIALTNWLADPNYPIAERLPRAAAFLCDAMGAEK
jgi:AcrR family transcriptional regulator